MEGRRGKTEHTPNLLLDSTFLPPQTKVIKLPLEKRREEIARMLSGIDVTPEARAAANTLLSRYEL